MPTAEQRYIEHIVKELGDRRKVDNNDLIDSRGSRRPRIRVSKGFRPALTERQQTVLRGKARTARSWGRVLQILADSRMTMEEFVEGLSNEELARGKLRDKNGNFTGRPPQFIPRAFHRACIGELMRRGKEHWQTNYIQAIETMTDIACGRGVGKIATPAERLKAAQFVIERLEGKVPEKLIVEQGERWELVIDGIIADVSDEAVGKAQKALTGAKEAEAEILDAEIVEEEPVPARPQRYHRRRR